MVRTVIGKNGGKLYVREKGDPSPNKGKVRNSTASLVEAWAKLKKPKLSKAMNLKALSYIFEMTLDEVKEQVKSGTLPVALLIEITGWLNKKNGADNLRRSMEKVFGKEADNATNIFNQTTNYVVSEQKTVDAMEDIRRAQRDGYIADEDV